MGAPKKYTSAVKFSARVDEYFDWCDTESKDGEAYKPYTVSGLCLYLGMTRETLSQYAKEEKFSDTIKRAKMKIENWIEENSLAGKLNPTVSIFNLKNNFGWKDKQEVEHSGDGLEIRVVTID